MTTVTGLHKADITLRKTREANIAYGSKILKDDLPDRGPYMGAWILLIKKQPEVGKYIFVDSSAVNQWVHKVNASWPENDDPFTQENLLNREDNQVQDLIYQIKRFAAIIHWEKVANRLITLFKDAKEEDPTSLGISVGSLRNFYNFIRLYSNLKSPTISLTPDNNIYASWRVNQKTVFSIHFLPLGDVRFVIFKPNDRHPERQIRISGTTTTDILKATVAHHGVWDWISA